MSEWRKSSYSGVTNSVEVAVDGGLVGVRDSKHPRRVVTFTAEDWAAFLAGVKAGEFDPAES